MGKLQKLLLLLLSVFCIATTMTVAQDNEAFTVGLLVFDPLTFIEEMTSLGYVAGENIEYMMLSFEGMGPDTPPEVFMASIERQVQAMLDAPVDVLVVQNDTDAVNLRQQTDIPIVFAISDDPITTGAVADLTTPGGLTTGVVSNQHHVRRLQLLKEINPDTDAVFYLYSAFALEGEQVLTEVRALGDELGIAVMAMPVSDTVTGIAALQTITPEMDWIFVTPYLPFDPVFNDALLQTSMTSGTPIAGFIADPTYGYLVNYGPSLRVIAYQSAIITDQILRGANPAELPVVTAENSLTINLEVAEQLGIALPVAILRQADRIVRAGELTPFPMFDPNAGN